MRGARFSKVGAHCLNLTVARKERQEKDMAKTLGQPENKSQGKPSHEEIARRAYEIFEQNGRTPGCDLENWLAAEAQLTKAQRAQTPPSNGVRTIAKPAYREPAESRA